MASCWTSYCHLFETESVHLSLRMSDPLEINRWMGAAPVGWTYEMPMSHDGGLSYVQHDRGHHCGKGEGTRSMLQRLCEDSALEQKNASYRYKPA